MSEKKEYIERGAALELFWENSGNWNLINAIPAADVEPVVRGEWGRNLKIESESTVNCSICGNLISAWYKTKRCPNCGAHMMERSGSGETY